MSEITISQVWAREILDARGLPTIEISVYLSNQAMIISSISTDSANEKNATELTAIAPEVGYTISPEINKLVDFINQTLGPAVTGQNPVNQEQIDQTILSLVPKIKALGVGWVLQTTMAVSMAVTKAAAASYGWPVYYYLFRRYQLIKSLKMPVAVYGMFNGGRLGNENIDFSEVSLIPARHVNFARGLQTAVVIFTNLRKILMQKGGGSATSSLGGLIPVLYKNTDTFDLLVEAIKASGLVMGRDLFFGVDVNAHELFSLGRYKIKDSAQPLASGAMAAFLEKLHANYGVYLMEDPFDVSDTGGWKSFNEENGDKIRICSDRMTNSQPDEIKKAISQKLCNTFLIKPGQVAVMTHLVQIAASVRQNNAEFVIAHREGETSDDVLADLAVGLGADFVKFGAPNRGERIAKYNRLLKIAPEVDQVNAEHVAQSA
jgi:enolase